MSSGGPTFIFLRAIQALCVALAHLNTCISRQVYQLEGVKMTLLYSAVPSVSLTIALRIAFCVGHEILGLTHHGPCLLY